MAFLVGRLHTMELRAPVCFLLTAFAKGWSCGQRRWWSHEASPDVTGDVLPATIPDNESKTLDLKLTVKIFDVLDIKMMKFLISASISSGRFRDQRFPVSYTEEEGCVKGYLKIQAVLEWTWLSASSSNRSKPTTEAVHQRMRETAEIFERNNWS